MQALLNQVVDFVGDMLDYRRGLEIAHVFDARDNLVSAGLGQERHVVALALVTVVTAEVEYAQVALVRVLARNQVVLRRNDVDAWNVQFPVLGVVYYDKFLHDLFLILYNEHVAVVGHHAEQYAVD